MNKKKYFLLALFLVVLIIAAYVGYQALSDRYNPDDTADAAADTQTDEAAAADFTVLDADGNSVTLSDTFGKPIILNFWATWCSYCKEELPTFDEAYAAYGDDIRFMMIDLTDGSRDTIDSVKTFVADAGYTFPVYFDTKLDAADTYGAYSIPMTVFINADGTVLHTYTGAITETKLNSYIGELLGK